MSQAVRNRRNRKNSKVRNTDVLGNGVSVDATRYASGRTQVIVETLVPATAQQAAYVFDSEGDR
jgi:hypothetical protein